ncbi:MAG: HAD-IIIC family phosphatase [Gammaproteobacteria bacterium]|nr:HAD-IIIC family phosphatase [Gammaproteobacteria bacterium]
MTPSRLMVLGDTTLGSFVRELQAQCRAASLPWTVEDGGFDSWERAVLGGQATSRQGAEAAFAFVLSPRLLEGFDQPDLPRRIQSVLEALEAQRPQRTVMFGNLFADPRGVLPLLRPQLQARRARRVADLLDDFSARHAWFHLVDQSSLALALGVGALSEPRFEALGGLYFSPSGSRHLAALWCRALAALTRPPAKVLALDLDNVLWGGIVGEDGPARLAMGPSGAGWFYRRFQQALLELKRSGVLLAVCSKNNAAEALAVLREHEDCLLRPDDFAALEIGWDRKSLALQRIAQRLRLGLDSFVFVDDAAFEREEVRQALPEVRVLEFPPTPAGLLDMLTTCTAFDRLRVTDEDRTRSASYQAEARRDELRGKARKPEDFYRSLGLTARIQVAGEDEFARAHQLIHKTNQFNLTSERLSAEQLRERLADPGYQVLTLRVADRFGDSGLVGLAMLDRHAVHTWRVDNFLLSCRVIGRTVENAFVSWLAQRARVAGVARLEVRFVANGRNEVAREFLERSGLRASEDRTIWSLDVAAEQRLPEHYVKLSPA